MKINTKNYKDFVTRFVMELPTESFHWMCYRQVLMQGSIYWLMYSEIWEWTSFKYHVEILEIREESSRESLLIAGRIPSREPYDSVQLNGCLSRWDPVIDLKWMECYVL
jgi:hypothetical protein